jgi:hypothetical protein
VNFLKFICLWHLSIGNRTKLPFRWELSIIRFMNWSFVPGQSSNSFVLFVWRWDYHMIIFWLLILIILQFWAKWMRLQCICQFVLEKIRSYTFLSPISEIFAFLIFLVIVSEFRSWHDIILNRDVNIVFWHCMQPSTITPVISKHFESINFFKPTLID